jgi:phosphotransferase system HPr (HPr) family protein
MTDEARATFRLVNTLGLHTRAATLIAKTAAGYNANVRLVRDDQQARAESVLELLQLCSESGTRLEVVAVGDDAADAVRAIGDLINDRFGESA